MIHLFWLIISHTPVTLLFSLKYNYNYGTLKLADSLFPLSGLAISKGPKYLLGPICTKLTSRNPFTPWINHGVSSPYHLLYSSFNVNFEKVVVNRCSLYHEVDHFLYSHYLLAYRCIVFVRRNYSFCLSYESNWVSKLNHNCTGFALLHLMNGLENSTPSQSIKCHSLKPIKTWWVAFSCISDSLHVFNFRFHCLCVIIFWYDKPLW